MSILLAALPLAAAPPTFNRDVAPIMFQNCTSCHRRGEAGPFPLTNYEEAKKRGALLVAVTEARIMPPWHAADTGYRFLDERRLTGEQIATLRAWVEAGMPEGSAADKPVPPAYTEGWQLGEPDLIVEFADAYAVPAEGPDLYRSFAIPVGLPEDKWIRAIEFRPQARGASHHALFFADATGEAVKADRADSKPGFGGMAQLSLVRGRGANPGGLAGGLGGWAVGGLPRALPDGLARLLPAGADLVVQMHFHPSGKPETEQARLGLYFADRAPERTLAGIQIPPMFGRFAGIDIPAGEKDFVIRDSFVTPVDVRVVGAGGHAHYLCTEMKMTATLPSGEERTLVWIDRWDFAWQERYYYADEVVLPAGTRLDVEIRYDNSADNPANPNRPPKRVTWGRESEDEMGSVSIEVVALNEADLPKLRQAQREQMRGAIVTGVREAPGRWFRRLRQD